MEFTVLLNMTQSVPTFVTEAEKCDFDINVHSANRKYIVDGKSIMGLFSLDLSSPVTVQIEDPTNGKIFKEKVAKYVVS